MAGIAGANELNDRQRFRGFYRTSVSHEFVGPALAEMARQFNWTQMAIVTQSESIFSKVGDDHPPFKLTCSKLTYSHLVHKQSHSCV
jgi:hypothetical protein